jgi:hypothetical protein
VVHEPSKLFTGNVGESRQGAEALDEGVGVHGPPYMLIV